MSADADIERCEHLGWIIEQGVKQGSSPRDSAEEIIAELRRRGAWLPGSEVSDQMAVAACRSFETSTRYCSSLNDMRAAITAALAARTPHASA